MLAGVEEVDSWSEFETGNRWFVEYQIGLVDKNASWLSRVMNGGSHIELGYVSLLACSQAFTDDPSEGISNDLLKTAVILDAPDATYVKRYLSEKLAALTSKNKAELQDQLTQFLHVDNG